MQKLLHEKPKIRVTTDGGNYLAIDIYYRYLWYMRNLRYIPHYTVADYQTWEGSWELIDGLPHAMTPSPIIKHQYLSALLVANLHNEFKKNKADCGSCIFVSEVDWMVSDETVLRPDVAIICNQTGDFITKAPALIIEILSPSTAIKDKNLKFEIYEEQGVPYYLILNPETLDFEIYQLTDGKYKAENDTLVFTLPDGCNINFNVTEILKELSSI